ncbi:MAG TPA: hypothetical protein VK550_18275 [Polyangiaceae bacterium]|nr:hypothetical protein [Polyangiaceae bacterium]
MWSTRRMTWNFGAAAFAVCLLACDKEEAKPAPAASSLPLATVSAPPVASVAPVASAPERKPVHPCPEGSTGKGLFDDPCKGKGKTRMMDITWDKKIGDKGPTFKIINNAKLEILYGKVVVYFYDKAGKQLETKVGDKAYRRLTCAGNIFAGAVKPGEKVFMNFSCVKKDDVPKGAVTIEGEISTVAFTDDAGKNDTYWRNDDLIPDERPKGGIK